MATSTDVQKKRAIWADDAHWASLQERAAAKGLNPSTWLRDVIDQLDAREAQCCPMCKRPKTA